MPLLDRSAGNAYQINYMEVSKQVFKMAYCELINRLVSFGDEMVNYPDFSRNRIYSGIINVTNIIDEEINKIKNNNFNKEPKFFQMDLNKSYSDDDSIFQELAKNNINFKEEDSNNIKYPTKNEVCTPMGIEHESTPNPNGLTDSEYKSIISNLRYYEPGKNPIYEPRNYFNEHDSPEVIVKKLKKALLLKKGFFKEPLEKTQRKKRNGIIRSFLKNNFKLDINFIDN